MSLNFLFCFVILIGKTLAGGKEIVNAARSQIGVSYSWGGGNWKGKSLGINYGGIDGTTTTGFDCSGLVQYAVFKGTGKLIQRVSYDQYEDKQCKNVPFAERQPGDLVFFYNSFTKIRHVAIISGLDLMIEAPFMGQYVREIPIYPKGWLEFVKRCF